MATLADFKCQEIIESAIHPQHNKTAVSTNGELKFTFYTFDGTRDVIIDDRLPQAQNSMAQNGDYWVPLFEKAYAKLNGSYNAIDGGYTRTSMWHLTGGISIDMDTDWLYATETKAKTDFYFKLLNEMCTKYNDKRRVAICAGNTSHSDGSDNDEKGLVSYHAYSVLDCVEVSLFKRFHQSFYSLVAQ